MFSLRLLDVIVFIYQSILPVFFIFEYFSNFRAESGPAGAQFGILASLIVEVVNVWPALKSPSIALGNNLLVLMISIF